MQVAINICMYEIIELANEHVLSAHDMTNLIPKSSLCKNIFVPSKNSLTLQDVFTFQLSRVYKNVLMFQT